MAGIKWWQYVFVFVIATFFSLAFAVFVYASVGITPSEGENLGDGVITTSNPSDRHYIYYETVSADWCSYIESIDNGVTTMGNVYNEHFSGSGNCAGTSLTTEGDWILGHYNGSIIDETDTFTVTAGGGTPSATTTTISLDNTNFLLCIIIFFLVQFWLGFIFKTSETAKVK